MRPSLAKDQKGSRPIRGPELSFDLALFSTKSKVMRGYAFKSPEPADSPSAIQILFPGPNQFSNMEIEHRQRIPMSEALFDQAKLAQQTGDYDTARTLCRRILADSVKAPLSVIQLLCLIEHQCEDYEAALPLAGQLVQKMPENLGFRRNHAALLGSCGRFQDAANEYVRVLHEDPDDEVASMDLASAYLRMSKARAAVIHLEEVIVRFPNLVAARLLLGKALVATGDYQEARSILQDAHMNSQGDLETAMVLADVQATTGQIDEAIRLYRQLLGLFPEASSRITSALGNAHGFRGDIELASNLLAETVKSNPENYGAARSLTLQKPVPTSDPLVQRLLSDFQNPALRDIQRSQVAFALAKIFDDAKDYEKAAAYFRAGNRALRVSHDTDGLLDEEPVYRRIFDMAVRIMENLVPESVRVNSHSVAPILIVGMPRSGSTMTEQIIGAHSRVNNAGEMGYLSAAFARYIDQREDLPVAIVKGEGINEALNDALKEMRDYYLDQLAQHVVGAGIDFVTDKWLYNFLRVGVILSLIPDARIVWCVRDIRDTSVSIFNTYFARGHKYATSFDDIAKVYSLHQDVLSFWTERYPTQIYLQSYEALVLEPTLEVPKLLASCGLSMEAACLDFHNRDNSVMTASMAQVRQPIHKDSVARWQRYGGYQPALEHALNRHGLISD